MPYFSVIIPVYNRASIVQKAIDSVLDQTFNDFEVIIIDDGSTDGTREKVLANQDPRLQYHYQPNQGVCAARNYGALSGKGVYFVFLDSDDSVTKNWLEEFAHQLNIKPSVLVFCDVEMLNVKTKKRILYTATNPYREKKAKQSDGLYLTGAFCVRSDYFRKLGGYDTALKFGENTELRFRIIQNMPEIAFTNKTGLIYEMSNEGSQNPQNKIESIHYLLSKHAWFFKKYPHARRFYLQNLAIAFGRINEFSKARSYLLRAYLTQPWKLTTLIRLLFSLLPLTAKRLWK
jgi:glycosyltransferase involved in cell wall biosynthesis